MSENNSNDDPPEKNILVDRGIPMRPDSDLSKNFHIGAESNGSNSGWNIGVVGSGNGPSTTGLGPGRGRRRGITNKQLRRLLRQQEAEAHALAQRQAAEHAAHLARLEAEAHARAMAEAAERERVEAQVRAQAEKDQAHRQALETLTASYPSLQSGLAQNYLLASASLPNDLQKEIASGHDLNADPPRDEQTLELILQKKTRVNYLLAIKQPLLDERRTQALSLTGQELDHATQKDHLNYLVYYSQGDPPRVQQAHEAWVNALSQTYEAKLLAESVTLLNEQSAALSMRHAELSLANKPASQEARQAAGIDKLWSVITPASTTTAAPGIRTVATNIAKDQLIRIATRTLGSNLVTLLAMYPQPLGDAELPPAVIATPLSQLNLPPHIDLHYLASVKGTLDVPHRLTSDEAGTSGATRWVATDGVKVGTKVRVRTFTYNAQNNSYEFIRDGESTPALIWTPIARPADSSTSSPAGPPALPVNPGNVVTPFVPELEAYPAIDRDDPDDYILISPIDSGLPNSYLLFKDPRSIPGVASGHGEAVTATWLRGPTASQPAPIPSSVAEKLSGRPFASFAKLREAIWLEVSKDPELSGHLGELNLQELSNKRAPRAPLADRVGKRVKYEIHHKHRVSEGGSVYDLDNLIIMTPKDHIQTHRSNQ
ncbi:HNH endonuclease [Pseudomonas syringae]|nr:HNH endonuclease [Pseudomonas syringae pv. syringae]TFZ34173.1 HNH endonuclease [Pseudomonas syringae]